MALFIIIGSDRKHMVWALFPPGTVQEVACAVAKALCASSRTITTSPATICQWWGNNSHFLLRPALICFNHCFYALTDEKQKIYKLTVRHRVPRCELVDLLFFLRNCENVCKPLNILTRFYECLLNPRSNL